MADGAGEVELLLMGTGTSAGVPMIGCHCAVCTSTDPRDHRNRPGALVRYDGLSFLIDTTPELRLQCVRFGIDMVEAVVYTHAHADHILGLDELRRFNMIQRSTIPMRPNRSASGRKVSGSATGPPLLQRRTRSSSCETRPRCWSRIGWL